MWITLTIAPLKAILILLDILLIDKRNCCYQNLLRIFGAPLLDPLTLHICRMNYCEQIEVNI